MRSLPNWVIALTRNKQADHNSLPDDPAWKDMDLQSPDRGVLIYFFVGLVNSHVFIFHVPLPKPYST
jgi:hypothetical protein